VDRPVNGEAKGTREAAAFVEQMAGFLRRNLGILLAAGLLLLVVQDIFGPHGVLVMRRAQREAARVKQEIQQIDTENRQLEDSVRSLKSDPQTIERIAREEMGLARPGEYIFKIAPRTGEPSGPASPPAERPRNLSPAPGSPPDDGGGR
jgi:cell division protein FtsL